MLHLTKDVDTYRCSSSMQPSGFRQQLTVSDESNFRIDNTYKYIYVVLISHLKSEAIWKSRNYGAHIFFAWGSPDTANWYPFSKVKYEIRLLLWGMWPEGGFNELNLAQAPDQGRSVQIASVSTPELTSRVQTSRHDVGPDRHNNRTHD